MQYSTNYNLNLVEGTDIVNPLVIDKPNYQTIDAAMKANKDAAVNAASHTKAGTVHAIVRTNTDANVFRFVASAPFTAGDTFTVDGTAVTGINTAGENLGTNDFVIGASVLCVLNSGTLTLNVNKNVTIPSSYDASDINYSNTVSGLTAVNAQNAIDEVDSYIVNQKAGTSISVVVPSSVGIAHSANHLMVTVALPCYALNTSYTVTINSASIDGIGAVTGVVFSRQLSCLTLDLDAPGLAYNTVRECVLNLTVTFA